MSVPSQIDAALNALDTSRQEVDARAKADDQSAAALQTAQADRAEKAADLQTANADMAGKRNALLGLIQKYYVQGGVIEDPALAQRLSRKAG